jgi:hypothetical protein
MGIHDPHVIALHYRLETGPQLTFRNPPPLEHDTSTFTLLLAEGLLRVEPKNHFGTAEEARVAVGPYLRSWEIATAFRDGPGAIRFAYEWAEVIDRAPAPSRGGATGPGLGDALILMGEETLVHLARDRYPEPPDRFQASPEVLALWHRFEQYLASPMQLAAMAHYCLTTLEQSVGGKEARQDAAARYAIDLAVLQQLGQLAAARGASPPARQGPAGEEFRRYTQGEIAWMEAVVTRLIQRLGEWAADPTAHWPLLTMNEFPEL